MEREKIDFTDKELNRIARALQTHINERSFYESKGGRKVLLSAMQKVIDNGFTRKNPEKIIYPLVNFKTDDES